MARTEGIKRGSAATLAAAVIAGAHGVAAAATVVPLSNLFDDAPATGIDAAVASDTYGAQAQVGDLAVTHVIDFSNQQALNAAQTVAPGVVFNLASAGGGSAFARNIFNDAWQNNGGFWPLSTTGSTAATSAGPKIEDGIGMHANALITFDLNALRNAGASANAAAFFADYDQNDDQANSGAHRGVVIVSDANGNVLAGYINNQRVAVSQSGGVWSFTGPIPGEHPGSAANGIDMGVGLPSHAAYLTLASTSPGIASDHAAWSGARIDYAPTIALGNLFDDTRPGALGGTELWTALGTDQLKATAQATDLGVDKTQASLGAAQSLNSSTSVLFDFTNVGGNNATSDGIANDSIGAGTTSRPPLRLDGTNAGFPTGPGNDYNVKLEDGIGIHANQFVTFDLDEIREAGGLGNTAFRFTTEAGLNDSAVASGTDGIRAIVLVSDEAGVLAGYVNGELVDVSFDGVDWSFTGAIPGQFTTATADKSALFDVLLGRDARYLTLAATGGGNITSDHVAFVNANLTPIIPAPAALPAGLALLGAVLTRRPRRR